MTVASHSHADVIEVVVLDDKIAATCLAIGLPNRRDDAAHSEQARVMADLLQRIQDRLVGGLRGYIRAAIVLLAGVDVITVRVNDVPLARADERRLPTAALLARPAAILASCELLQLRLHPDG